MAGFDWSQCLAVESLTGTVSQACVFRQSRMPMQVVIEDLKDGMGIDEITGRFCVTREHVKAVIEFAPRSLDTVPLREVRQ